MITVEVRDCKIRGGPKHAKYGDPYTWFCNVIISDNCAEIIGLNGDKFTREDYVSIVKYCRDQGLKKLWYDRRREDGSTKRVDIIL